MMKNQVNQGSKRRGRYPFGSKALFDLFLFSTFTYVIAILLIRFIWTFIESALLSFFNIIYIFSPFSNYFTYSETGNWNLNKLIVVYGFVPFLFFSAGLLLLIVKTKNWKTNLLLTWLSFHLVNTLPVFILTGSFYFEGFGIAFQWMIQYLPIRIGLAVFSTGIMLWFRPFWVQRILRCAYTRELISSENKRRKYLLYSFILPWYASTLVLVPFAFSGHSWYWLISLIFMGLVVLPLFRLETQFEDVNYQTGKAIFMVRFPLLFVITVISLLWAISWYHVGH